MARILLVDDESTTFEAIKATLEGHELLWAQDEREAQESIARTPPNLIILDYLLGRTPSIPGTLVTLRGKLPSVPILVLTGHGSEDVAIQSLRAGANDYVWKPFDIWDLQGRVKMLLSSSPSSVTKPSLAPAFISSSLTGLAALHPALRLAIQARNCAAPTRLSLKELAAVAHVSPRQLIRIFKMATGVSPRRYFEKQLIIQGAKLLESTSLPVAEVAGILGFSDSSHFCRVFRRHTGTSPTASRLARK